MMMNTYVQAETLMIDENKLLFMHAQERVNHSSQVQILIFHFQCLLPFFFLLFGSFRTANSYRGYFIAYFSNARVAGNGLLIVQMLCE